MGLKPTIFWVFLLFLALPVVAFTQPFSVGTTGWTNQTTEQMLSRLQAGINFYSQGKWHEAVQELRRVQAESSARELRGEALFWISLSELSAGEYEQSLRDMDALEEADPENYRLRELPYHRGRVLYYLGRYDEAILLFRLYSDSLQPDINPADESKKVSAYYWTGECLYSMGQIDRAGEYFQLITDVYPTSPKYEASVYRLAMINQKKVETELLGLLKWSHEESLKNVEEFRRKESAYDQALSAYQKRITDMQNDTRIQDLEDTNAYFREQLIFAEERIRVLENTLEETSSSLERARESASIERLKMMRESARELETLLTGNAR